MAQIFLAGPFFEVRSEGAHYHFECEIFLGETKLMKLKHAVVAPRRNDLRFGRMDG